MSVQREQFSKYISDHSLTDHQLTDHR